MTQHEPMKHQMDQPKRDIPRPTLRTIADMTGLSLSTVSLAMRQDSKLKKSTREKVFEAAKQVGYVPDRAGVRLRTGKTNVLALALSGAENTSDYTDHLITGVADALRNTSYHLNVHPHVRGVSPLDMIRYIIDNRTSDGVILSHTTPNDPRVTLLQEKGLPFITHGRTQNSEPHAYFDLDSKAFVSMALDRFETKKCRRIMPFLADDDTMNYQTVMRKLETEVVKRGLTIVPPPASLPISDIAALRGFAQTFWQNEADVDGFFCGSEMVAIALLTGLQSIQHTPERMPAVVAKQTSRVLTSLFPAADTIYEDIEAAGRHMTGMLIDMIQNVGLLLPTHLEQPVPRFEDHSVSRQRK